MEKLWLLQHHKLQAHEDERLDPRNLLSMKSIGMYSSLRMAEEAIPQLLDQPGFRDWPGGFRITEVTLDRDLWPEGFTEAG
ncbi:Hypothetical protein HVPorG_04360 [Roseomonas mucosa]|uniref:hypothetical protein n=1 Tax=Roseomonas mucosa TaxID=207340 RepID=UPI0022057A99|nr:hypothetical protein [Roseomonas mucosa]QDJ11313.1 Hypothetical protein HVPorG_04360 [Roseomonas mucosa]